jgi:hypothetical protein
VKTTCVNYPGTIHGFFSLARFLSQGLKANDEAAAVLGAHFGTQGLRKSVGHRNVGHRVEAFREDLGNGLCGAEHDADPRLLSAGRDTPQHCAWLSSGLR